MRVIELFSGIGAFRQALINTYTNYNTIAISEISKHAIIAYKAMYNDYNTPNLGDILNVDKLPPCDLITYGFPCQDLSVAGYGMGIKEGTRSGLLLEVERLLKIAYFKNNLPKYLIMENVQGLIQKKHKFDFDKWLYTLKSMGYTNYYQVLDAKDHRIPQSRKRVFVISILGEHKPYIFPKKTILKLRLKDLLENEVDEKYYINKERTNKFYNMYKSKIDILEDGLYPFLTPDRLNKRQNGRRFKNKDDEMFTITKQDRHGVMQIGSISDKNSQGSRVYTLDMAVTQNGQGGGLGAKTGLYLIPNHKYVRIRKLTPLESWRLMGFEDNKFYITKKTLIDNLYKGKDKSTVALHGLAGNSIVVPVLEDIIIQLQKTK